MMRWIALIFISASALAGEITPLQDLEGHEVAVPDRDAAATVVIFVRTDCPISNRYAPEIKRLSGEYGKRKVRFWLVYPDPRQTPEEVRTHLHDYEFGCDPLMDPDHTLVEAVAAKVTPEAVVLRPDGTIAYQGRIDDWYGSFGKNRPRPTRHDLALALDAVLAGKEVETPKTNAIGCYIEDLKP